MIDITKDTVKHVSEISRLNLTDEEITKFERELKEILEAFKALDKVDTSNVEPSFQPIDIKNITREDKEEKCLSQEDSLKNTENKQDGFFKGPKVMDK